MLLRDKYFKLVSFSLGSGTAHYHVRLLPDCDVYRGHFPGNPVSPGVCNIEMIVECFNTMVDEYHRLVSIDRCRLTSITSPEISQELDIEMNWTYSDDGKYRYLTATIKDDKQQYMDFKGTLE